MRGSLSSRLVVALLAAVALSLAGRPASGTVTEIHQYDMEGPGFVTQAGWTHMQQSIAFTGTTAGFDLTQSHFTFNGVDRVTSTQAPTDVTRDEIIGNGQASLSIPTIVFRDIVPAWAQSVSFKIYHSDPADTFLDAMKTELKLDNVTQVIINGTGAGGTYFPPITGSFAISPVSGSTRTLDFYFYDPLAGSQVRLNGIEAIYEVPEPATASVMFASGAIALCGRRRNG